MLIVLLDKYIVYDFDYCEVISICLLLKEGVNRDYYFEMGYVVYIIGNNLYVDDWVVINELEGIVCGQFVYCNEFGIKKGIFWSFLGNLFVFYWMD